MIFQWGGSGPPVPPSGSAHAFELKIVINLEHAASVGVKNVTDIKIHRQHTQNSM